jgi:hypothetical protein
MKKPEINKTVQAIFINPYERTVKTIAVQGITHIYELLATNGLKAVKAPWGDANPGAPETMYLNDELQRNPVPENDKQRVWGFSHKLVTPDLQLPFVGSAIILRSAANGEDMDTGLTPEYVGGMIQFYEWQIARK